MMRPFNPSYRATWDAMTPAERRATVRFDIAVACVVLAAMFFIS